MEIVEDSFYVLYTFNVVNAIIFLEKEVGSNIFNL